MMRRIVLFGLMMGVFLCPNVVWGEEELIGYEVGKRALDFTLQDLNENEVTLSDHFGKVIVLTFWDWNCIECREESMPELQNAVQAEYGPDNVSIFAVNITPHPNVERLKGYVQEREIAYHVLLSGMEVAFEFNVYAIPILFVLDREGIIRYRQQKALEPAALELIKELVNEQSES